MLFIINFSSSTSVFSPWNCVYTIIIARKLEIKKRRKRGNATDSDREIWLFTTNIYGHKIISDCPEIFFPSSNADEYPNNLESLLLDYFASSGINEIKTKSQNTRT